MNKKTLQDLSIDDLFSLRDTLTLLKRNEMLKEIKQEIKKRQAKPMEKNICFKCGHEEEITENKIYQDIKGKFIICEKCNTNMDIEIKKDA
jgi:transcription elongation factor Elf1